VLGQAIEQIARCRLFAPTFLVYLVWDEPHSGSSARSR
jgi:hypothetical protein